MHLREKRGKQPDGRGKNGGEGHAQVNTVEQGTMTVLAPARSESLRNQRVQSHEQAATEKSQDDKNVGAQTDRAMAVALSGSRPTIIVSTIAMLIQPSSASTSGMASRSVGRNSSRSVWSPIMGARQEERV